MVGQNDSLVLKLIYRPNMQPVFTTLWKRMMKNCYSIGTQGNFSETGIKILYINDNKDTLEYFPDFSQKLVTVFGVDRIDNLTGDQIPDGLFDYRLPIYDSRNGLIMFPNTEPFDKGINNYFTNAGRTDLLNKYNYPDIYSKTKTDVVNEKSKDKYIISVERK
jgi:cell surface protein SprA